MRPLRAAIGGATRLLVSPDGELNLVPFEAFVDEQGRYLIERYAMSYLTSGRDLLRMQVPRVSRSPVRSSSPNPLFGEPARAVAPSRAARPRSAEPGAGPGGDVLRAAGRARQRRRARSRRSFRMRRSSPAATPRTRLLQTLEAPRMLHIASHGFFLRGRGVDVDAIRCCGPASRWRARTCTRRRPASDGILTALEASGLNLWGTKLVTLSACDTGVGEVRNGEGVYGCAARSCWPAPRRW